MIFRKRPEHRCSPTPSSQPFITAVGGTHITLNSNGVRTAETTWNDGVINQAGTFEGGGGGTSVFWPLPKYQTGLPNSANLGSNKFRNVPDVSLNSDPNTGYLVILKGNGIQVGGTSAAAPIWAGFTTLVNEARTQQGKSSIGFLNPTLYSLFQTAQYSQVMNDINDQSTNGHFPAVTGYDLATGWGTFIPQKLLPALATVDNGTIVAGSVGATLAPVPGSGKGSSSVTVGAILGSIVGVAIVSVGVVAFYRRRMMGLNFRRNQMLNNQLTVFSTSGNNNYDARMASMQPQYPGAGQMTTQNPMFANNGLHGESFNGNQQYQYPITGGGYRY